MEEENNFVEKNDYTENLIKEKKQLEIVII